MFSYRGESDLRQENPMTTPLDSLMDFFRAELASVQFPGVDAKVLDAAAARIDAATETVRKAEAELDAARATLAAAQDDAQQKAQRALAYARVYAQDNPTLLARLDALSSPAVPAPPAPRRRGRPPKSSTPLFAEPEPQAAELPALDA
jgi:ElaB/YqjD/DUF883 family membrane-anchored ribosome-binding protein